jgi:signal transduction histidine kinase
MLNLVTLFKCTSNDENQKKELFNLSEVITSISHRLAVVTTNKSKFILEFEQDVPENVYGDMTKFQQVITTLINFTNINSPVDDVVEIY